MIVSVHRVSVQIDEPCDFTGLKVLAYVKPHAAIERLRVAGLAEAEADAGARDVASESVWLDIARLRNSAKAASGESSIGWDESWEKMIRYAHEHGWVRDGMYVRAHVEVAQ